MMLYEGLFIDAQMNSNSVACLFVDAYASFDVWSLSNAVEEQSVDGGKTL